VCRHEAWLKSNIRGREVDVLLTHIVVAVTLRLAFSDRTVEQDLEEVE